jgi:cbb3-type cytochrome oxidase maturation protein
VQVAGPWQLKPVRAWRGAETVEILYLLIPLSAVLVLGILAIFGWAVNRGQFEDLEPEGERILTDDAASLDTDQVNSHSREEESRT